MNLQSMNVYSKPAYEIETEEILPTGVDYQTIKPLAKESHVYTREFTPSNGNQWTITTTSKTIIIPLTSTGFIDGRNASFNFTFTPTYNDENGNDCEAVNFSYSGHSIIKNLRIVASGNKIIEDLPNYNRLVNILKGIQYSTDNIMGGNSIKEGNSSTDMSGAGDTAYQYSISLMSGLFRNDRYIPIGFIKSLNVEIDLEIATRAVGTGLAADGVTSSYIISDISISAPILEFGSDFDDEFRQKLTEMNGFEWDLQSWYDSQNTISAGSSAQVNINHSFHSLKGLLFQMVDSADDTQRDAYIGKSYANANGLTQYQVKIGSKLYPDAPVLYNENKPARAYQELEKVVKLTSDISTCGTLNRENYHQYYHVIGVCLETYPSDGSMIRSGIDTTNAQQMTMKLRGDFAQCETHCFANYDAMVLLTPTGDLMATY